MTAFSFSICANSLSRPVFLLSFFERKLVVVNDTIQKFLLPKGGKLLYSHYSTVKFSRDSNILGELFVNTLPHALALLPSNTKAVLFDGRNYLYTYLLSV